MGFVAPIPSGSQFGGALKAVIIIKTTSARDQADGLTSGDGDGRSDFYLRCMVPMNKDGTTKLSWYISRRHGAALDYLKIRSAYVENCRRGLRTLAEYLSSHDQH